MRVMVFCSGIVIGWVLFAAVLPKGMPVGIVLLGLVTGALTAMTALGLVLIYRSTRIVNFAQAEIGGVAATVAVALVASKGVNYFVAVSVGLVIALVSGALIERVVIRRFFTAPRLILTVATIGLAQLLGGSALFLQKAIAGNANDVLFRGGFSTPFDFKSEIRPVVFNGNHLVAFLTVPVVLLGLTWLFNRTDTGIAVRAAADSQERAVLLGIPVRRLSSITWIVAAGLSGLAGVLSAGVLGQSAAGIAGPRALLAPLAAAVLGRFEKLTATLIASLGIGIFTQTVFWNYPRATTVDLALFAVILIALLFQRRGTTRVTGEDLGGFVAVKEVRPVPAAVQRLPEVRAAKVVGALLAVVLSLGAPWVVSNSWTVLLSFVAIYGVIGVSLVLLTGWSGQVTLGQFAFVGIGAATAGSLSVSFGLDYLLCLVAAAAVGGAVAVVIGLPALRIPGLFLAPVTIAFAIAVSGYFLNPVVFPSFTPVRVTRPVILDRFDLAETTVFYYFCLAGLALSIVLARNFRRSRVGRAVVAVRDNERMAAGFSIVPVRQKLVAFSTSGAIAGFAGGLYVLAVRGVPFNGFNPDQSLQVFTMAVVGGLGSIFGVLLGAAYVYGAQYLLSGAALLFATGAGLLIVLLLAPGGLAEVVYRARDGALRAVMRRRNLEVPYWVERADDGQPTDPSDTRVEIGDATQHGSRGLLPDLVSRLPRRRPTRGSRSSAPSTTIGSSRVDADADHSNSLLICENLEAGYGHLQVLFGVSFSVPREGILGLLGTNGAGKSTTLKSIVGLLPISHGRIVFDGEDVTALDPIERVKRGIVMVPAKGIFGSLTVRENLRLGGWTPRRAGEADFLDVTMAQVFELFPVLQQRLDQRASLLSGGEQQMLALAQGLLSHPRLLMIDELSLGLAPILVAEILKVVRTLNEAGLPFVMVEQSINVSTTIAHDSVFVEKGSVRYQGATSELALRDDIVHSVFFGRASNAQPQPLRPRAERIALASPSSGAARHVLLSAKGIRKTYGAVTAIDSLDLDVYTGQVLGIIGSNGAGKTTAFDILSGFTQPDAGTLHYNGHEITRLSASKRAALGFGRTFQDVRLLPSMTVAETLAVSLERHIEVREPVASTFRFAAAVRSERAVARAVDQLLETFGLERYRNAFVSELPTGVRRVLELACATGHRPRLLLLDEPSSGLSQAESEEMAEVLLDLAARTKATLVIIEHDVPLVSGLADELVCMHLGTVIARGEPGAVLSHPDVIASYLGGDDATIQRSGAHPNGNQKVARVMSVAEYATLRGLSLSAVRRRIEAGEIDATRTGREWSISLPDESEASPRLSP
jgi:branched-chain amino acid transport system permease protein